MMPQYYGQTMMTPWGMYPAPGVMPQGPAPGQVGPGQQPGPGQRRPLSPSSLSDHPPVPQGQYQVIPAYYDQNGSLVMGNMRGIGNGGPVRLMSPAPMVLNPAAAATSASMRLMGNQPQAQMTAQQQPQHKSASSSISYGKPVELYFDTTL